MKDYDHVILWLDYFNKNLKVRQGRKIKRERAVFDPTVTELVEATKAAGFDVADGVKKSKAIGMVAEKLLQKRARQKSGKK